MSGGLRFCMVTTFYPPFNFGGDGIGVQRLSQALVRRGHAVTVIHDSDAYRALHRGPMPDEPALGDGVEVVRLRSSLGALSPLLTQQTGQPMVHGRTIRRLLTTGRYDVINFHNVSLVGGPGVLSAGSRDALTLYMAHEHWLVCPTHVLWRHGREVCTGRQCLRCTLHHHRPPQLWRYAGYLDRQLAYVDTFIAMSEFSRDKHREFGFPRPMEVLPYFLPDAVEDVARPTPTRPHPRPFFLFVGRLERIKGLEDVLPIFRGDGDADLLIAGDGEYAGVLTRLAADAPRVHFLGRVPPQRLEQYYAHAVALIVPSICFETFGIILIEAFRQGTPVVARRLGPLPEVVNRCGGGKLFSNTEELRTALDTLQRDPALRARLGRAGYDGYRQHWSERAVMPRYFDILRRTADAKGQTRLSARLTAEVAG